jgi:minimal PKS acyl carrier protein
MNNNQLAATQAAKFTLAELAILLTAGTGAQVDPASIDASTTFDDIGVDSLGLLGVVTTIERGRGVVLPDDVQQVEQVTQFVAVVNDNLRKRG